MQFCISVRFIGTQFHGQGDGNVGEWPPSPLRLYQALLAGSQAKWHSSCFSEKQMDAFRWLEKQPSPQIIAPNVHRSTGYTFFVPNNDGNKPNDQGKTSKTALPHYMLDGQTVHYVWQIAEDALRTTQSHIDILIEEARHLLALGWGIDMVVGHGQLLSEASVAQLPGERWSSWETGLNNVGNPLRIPISGTLDALFAAHQSAVNSLRDGVYYPPVKCNRFGEKHYRKQNSLPKRNFAVFNLDGLTESTSRPRFRQDKIAHVSGMLRHLAYGKANHDSFQFPGGADAYVAGHRVAENNIRRFSYLPLPTIGHQHADGLIRRVIVSEPYDENAQTAQWAARRLLNGELVDEAERLVVAVLSQISARDYVSQLYTSNVSDTWASVTPVLLPGHDEGKYEKALTLLTKAIQHTGITLSLVKDVVLSKVPFWSSSLHANEYLRPKHLKQHSGWHVKLQFYEQVYGPITLGTGRFCGLGLFAAL